MVIAVSKDCKAQIEHFFYLKNTTREGHSEQLLIIL